jgi:flagellar hook-basal body complex protein FliE
MNPIPPMANVLQQIDGIYAGKVSSALPLAVINKEGIAFVSEFGQMLNQSLQKISTAQASVGHAYAAFEMGTPNVSISNVIIDGAKARIAFPESLEIRNRLVSAYSTIMEIPI